MDNETWFAQVPEDRTQRTRATEGGHNIVRVTSKSELRRNFFQSKSRREMERVAFAGEKNPNSVKLLKCSEKGKTPLRTRPHGRKH